MKRGITSLIEESNYNHFDFKSGQNDPTKHLKSASLDVPDVDGIYFVFTPRKDVTECDGHLNFDLDNRKLKLIYFGIAGGIAKSGKIGNQKLKGRINNVVGASSIKRAKYWDAFMTSNGIEEFKIYYCPLAQPQNFEKSFYQYLDTNKLIYPALNKRRGRPSEKRINDRPTY